MSMKAREARLSNTDLRRLRLHRVVPKYLPRPLLTASDFIFDNNTLPTIYFLTILLMQKL